MFEISMLIIAIAVVVLVIYLSIFLTQACKLLKKLNQTVNSVNDKMDAFNPLFDAAALLNDRILDKARSEREEDEPEFIANASASFKNTSSTRTLKQAMEWVAIGVAIWQAIKHRRR